MNLRITLGLWVTTVVLFMAYAPYQRGWVSVGAAVVFSLANVCFGIVAAALAEDRRRKNELRSR